MVKRMSRAEVITLAEEALARGDSDVWQKVVDNAKAGNKRALEYLRGNYEQEPEPEPPFIGWRCERCGRRLPTGGLVWKGRQRKWRARGKETSGYYCDGCANARESGMDW